jgi:hypothetical protein
MPDEANTFLSRCPMKPFALVQIEDGSVSEENVIGDSDVSILTIDWDTMADSAEDAEFMINEIKSRYLPGEKPIGVAKDALDRLQEIVNEAHEEDEEEDDDDDLDFDDDDDFRDEIDLDEEDEELDDLEIEEDEEAA